MHGLNNMQVNTMDGKIVSKILQTSPNNNSLPEGVWSLEYRGMIIRVLKESSIPISYSPVGHIKQLCISST